MPVTTLQARTAAKSLIRTLQRHVAEREADNARDRKLIAQGELVELYTRHCAEREQENNMDRKSIKFWTRHIEIYDERIARDMEETG